MKTRAATVPVAVFGLVVVACTTPERPRGPFPETAPSLAPPSLLSGSPPRIERRLERMQRHAMRGVALREAVTRGDLKVARVEANELAHLLDESDVDPSLRAQLQTMRTLAERARDARDLHEMAAGVASVAAACGACHAAKGGPHPSASSAPPAAPDAVEAHMTKHAWAVARLWEGLVAPSSAAWLRGADALAGAPLRPESLTPGKSPVPAVGALTQRVHELGVAAKTAEATPARVEIMGDVLSTCGSCHERLGGP